MQTFNRTKIEMANGVSYFLSNAKMPKDGMKKNHAIMVAKENNQEYIVNLANRFAYGIK